MSAFDINTPAPATPHPVTARHRPRIEYPSTSQMAANLGSSIAKFARSGFTTTDPDTLASRMDTCKACDLWDAAGMAGTGRCRKCGCSTQAKLRMASEKCPIGKW